MTISFYASYDPVDKVRSFIRGLEGPNWNNDNAARLLGMMELGPTWEAVPVELPTAFRAVMTAKARFDRTAKDYVREAVREERYFCGSLDEDGLWLRLQEFEAFLVKARDLGAKTIYWG